MADIVTPYPVGAVTDPFVDCEDCTVTDPYATGGWSYDAAWTPITNEFNAGSDGLSWMVVYNGKFYFTGTNSVLYECNPTTGSVTSVAAAAGSGSFGLWSIQTGSQAGIYTIISSSTDYLCKWNGTDAWVKYAWNSYPIYGMTTYNNLLYLGALYSSQRKGKLATWNGTTFTIVKDETGFPVQAYTPCFLFVKNSTLYAVCIQLSILESDYQKMLVASWDFSAASWTIVSDVLSNYSYSLTYAVWHNDTIYVGLRTGGIKKVNLSTGAWTTLSGSLGVNSMVSHADGRLYVLTGISDLWYYAADDSGPTQLIDNDLNLNLDWRMVQYDDDLYCLYDIDYVDYPIYVHYIGKFGISEFGCTVTDPYNIDCTDPAYTT